MLRTTTTSPIRTPSGVTKRVAERRSREHGSGGGRRRAGAEPRAPTGANVAVRRTPRGQPYFARRWIVYELTAADELDAK